jgi:hypothetical protein
MLKGAACAFLLPAAVFSEPVSQREVGSSLGSHPVLFLCCHKPKIQGKGMQSPTCPWELCQSPVPRIACWVGGKTHHKYGTDNQVTKHYYGQCFSQVFSAPLRTQVHFHPSLG